MAVRSGRAEGESVTFSSAVLFVIAALLTFVIHEGAHWAMGEWLGYDMILRVNSVDLARGDYASEVHRYAVTSAGPAVTLLQGAIAFALIRGASLAAAFPFLLSALLMRVLAAGVSVVNPNDEMRLSLWLGLGPWTVFAAVIGVLLVMTLVAGWLLRPSWRLVAGGALCWLAVTAVIVLGEPYLPVYDPYASTSIR